MASKSIQDQILSIRKVVGRDKEIPDYRFTFGKYKGDLLETVFKQDPKYLLWLYYNAENLNKTLEKFIREKLVKIQ